MSSVTHTTFRLSETFYQDIKKKIQCTHCRPTFQAFCSRTWERIKQVFSSESKDTRFLKELLGKDTLNQQQLNKVAEILVKTVPYSLNSHLIHKILRNLEPEGLKYLIDCSLDQLCLHDKGSVRGLLNFIKDGQLEKITEKDVECLMRTLSKLPSPLTRKQVSFLGEIRKIIRVVSNYLLNIYENALKAVGLIKVGKGPQTLWDFAATMEIYFKLFVLPYSIFMLVSSFLALSAQVYLVTAALLILVVVATSLYLKYRPCPNELPSTHNLTAEAQKGNLEPVNGRDVEIEQISRYLGKRNGLKTNIILTGEPGVGKTELVKGLAQRYRNKRIFSIKPESTSAFQSFEEKLSQIFADVKGNEDKVIFFIDELGHAVSNGKHPNIAGVLKPLLGPDGVQVIATATEKEYKEHILKDESLASRFFRIPIKPTTKEQTLEILNHKINQKARFMRFSYGIVEKIEEISRKKEKSNLREAMKVLGLAINEVGAYDIRKFSLKQLKQKKAHLTTKRLELEKALLNQKTVGDIEKEIDSLEADIEKLEKKNEVFKKEALLIQKLMKKQSFYVQRQRQLASKNLKQVRKELLFIHDYLLPWLERSIIKHLKTLTEEIPMQVDIKLIEKIEKELYGVENH